MSNYRRAALALSSLLLASVLLPAATRAAPSRQRLSFTDDPSTTITVTWNTATAEATEVRYGTAPGKLAKATKGTSADAGSELGFIHEVTLTGLSPATTYYYTAGSAASGFTAERSFTTGPPQHASCGSARFVFLGDNRPDRDFGGGENWPKILAEAAKHKPSFLINGGDLVLDGDDLQGWMKFLAWTEPVAATVPFVTALGNHDDGPGEGDGAFYNKLLALPRSAGTHGSNTEDYYFFSYGNAIFVALSSQSFKGGKIPFAKQAAWLDDVLTNNPRKWRIVFFHHPIYTAEAFFDLSHSPNERGQNQALVEVIDKHHVDVVLTSHNHWYERFEPSACGKQGKPGSDQPCPVGANNYAGGTVYYVSGGAGAFTVPELFCGLQLGRAKCAGDHHYLVAEINDEVLKIDTWTAMRKTNKVIDSITITKPANAACKAAPPDSGGGPGDGAPGDGRADSTAADAAAPPADGGPPADARLDTGSAGDTQTDGGFTASDDGCSCQTTGAMGSLPLALVLLALPVLARRGRRSSRQRCR